MTRAARACKVDANQPEIVDTFRKLGCSVAITSSAGDGFSDLVVGVAGLNLLVEVKDGSKVPSAQKLTKDQVKFRDNWRGQYCVVNSVNQAIELVNRVRRSGSLNSGWACCNGPEISGVAKR